MIFKKYDLKYVTVFEIKGNVKYARLKIVFQSFRSLILINISTKHTISFYVSKVGHAAPTDEFSQQNSTSKIWRHIIKSEHSCLCTKMLSWHPHALNSFFILKVSEVWLLTGCAYSAIGIFCLCLLLHVIFLKYSVWNKCTGQENSQ